MAQSILIVDDEQQLRDMLGDALSQAGYQVRAARNVPEGRNELDSEAFDIVVLDINMNGSENGFDLLRWMRRTKKQKSEPCGPLSRCLAVLPAHFCGSGPIIMTICRPSSLGMFSILPISSTSLATRCSSSRPRF